MYFPLLIEMKINVYNKSSSFVLSMNKIKEDKVNARNTVKTMIEKYVKRGPFLINPDKVVADNIIVGLAKNKMKHGYAYCPCREVSGILENDRQNICPCRSHKVEIKLQGICECGLFVSENYAAERNHKKMQDASKE